MRAATIGTHCSSMAPPRKITTNAFFIARPFIVACGKLRRGRAGSTSTLTAAYRLKSLWRISILAQRRGT